MKQLLHGENIVESRKYLSLLTTRAQKEGKEIVVLDGTKVLLSEIRNALESDSLLCNNRLLILENLLSARKSKEQEKIIDYLSEAKFDNDLVLWEAKEFKKNPLDGMITQVFKINQNIFPFLESLRPGNEKQMLDLLMKTKKQEEPEMIFFMLIRQFRLLLITKSGGSSPLPDWQKKKLMTQVRHFTKEHLAHGYQELLEIDFGQKTSKDPYPLSSRLDLFVANL